MLAEELTLEEHLGSVISMTLRLKFNVKSQREGNHKVVSRSNCVCRFSARKGKGIEISL